MQNGQDQRIAMTWAAQSAETPVSIMALHGLGKELWEEVDAQAYVATLRREWERTAMQSTDTLAECEHLPLQPHK